MVDTGLTGEGNGSPLLYSCLEKSMDSPWVRSESDTAERLNTHKSNYIKELDHKEGWAPKNCCFWTVVLESFESPLDCKEIKPVNPKGSQSWIFNGRTDAEAEAPMQRANSLEKTLMLGKMKAGREGGDRRWDGWMVSLSKWTWVWASSEIVKDREDWHAAVHGVTKNGT